MKTRCTGIIHLKNKREYRLPPRLPALSVKKRPSPFVGEKIRTKNAMRTSIEKNARRNLSSSSHVHKKRKIEKIRKIENKIRKKGVMAGIRETRSEWLFCKINNNENSFKKRWQFCEATSGGKNLIFLKDSHIGDRRQIKADTAIL